MDELVVVGNYNNVFDASAARSFLESAGIPSQLKNEFNNQTMRIFDQTGSAIQLLVKSQDSSAAIEALLDHGMLHREDLGPDANYESLNNTLHLLHVDTAIKKSQNILYYILAFVFVLLLFMLIAYKGGFTS